MSDWVLLGDVGGTSTRFGLLPSRCKMIDIVDAAKLSNDEYASFDAALEAFLATVSVKPAHVFLAVSGPVEHGEVELTNRNWSISVNSLKARFRFKTVVLVNDFAAMARAVPELDDDRFDEVKAGVKDASAPVLVAGPGTGLGMATLVPLSKGNWRVMGSEGGHSAFSPRNKEDVRIGEILHGRFGFVSYELVTSGMGLEPVHRAMCSLHKVPYTPMSAQEVVEGANRGIEICQRICKLRARAVMSFAGDMALANATRGGVALAGGVATRLLPWLRQAEAVNCFLDRGPRSAYMEDIPVELMRGEFIPLVGAAALYQDGVGAE